MRIIKNPVKKSELLEIARDVFGDFVKVVVDLEQKIMAVGGELHADEEVLLMEKENSDRQNTWGINIYPEKSKDEWIEFDSMVNLKPALGNRSRDVENPVIREKIKSIIQELVID
ncbi:MAG: hypothetical protein HYV52_00510 [Parcubacteria group bacterium]|nr:hypothetical protein [Parcubacteria group bacterium]